MENKRKPKGRPGKIEKPKRINIYISSKHHEKAKVIGNGNFSKGITKLIDLY